MAQLKHLVRLFIVAGAFLVEVPSSPVVVATVAVGSGIGVSGCSCSHCCQCAWDCFGSSGHGTIGDPNSSGGGCLNCDSECESMAISGGCSSSSVTSAGECN
jgi:hypothetical protein